MADEDDYEALSPNAGLGVRQSHVSLGELHDPFSLTHCMDFYRSTCSQVLS